MKKIGEGFLCWGENFFSFEEIFTPGVAVGQKSEEAWVSPPLIFQPSITAE